MSSAAEALEWDDLRRRESLFLVNDEMSADFDALAIAGHRVITARIFFEMFDRNNVRWQGFAVAGNPCNSSQPAVG